MNANRFVLAVPLLLLALLLSAPQCEAGPREARTYFQFVNETRSLFRIGVVRDVYRIGGTLLAAAALGSNATDAFLHEQTVYLIMPDGSFEPFEADVAAASTLGTRSGLVFN